MFSSWILLINSLILTDVKNTRADGILGYLECIIFNTGFLLWGGLVTSTWNLVCLTIER